MVSLRYLWIIESRVGQWKHWISKGKKGPMPDVSGWITLEKIKYIVDPRRFRRWTLRIGLLRRRRQYMVQLWKQNDPTPIDFLHVKIPDPRFTGQMIQTMSKAKRIDKIILGEQFDIVKMALILSLIGNIAVIGWLISQAASVGGR